MEEAAVGEAAVVAEAASVVAEPMVVEPVAVGCAVVGYVVECVSVLVAVSSSSCRVRRAAPLVPALVVASAA